MKRIQLEIKDGCFRNPFAPPDELPRGVFFSEEMFVMVSPDGQATDEEALTCERIVRMKRPLKPGEFLHFFGGTTVTKEDGYSHRHEVYAVIIEVSDTALTLELIDLPKRYLRQIRQ